MTTNTHSQSNEPSGRKSGDLEADAAVALAAEQFAQTSAVVDPLEALAEATGVKDPAALKAILAAAMEQMNAAHSAEMAAVRQELSEVRDTQNAIHGRDGVKEDNTSLGGMPWMYYKFPETWPDEQRRGWISMGPGGQRPRDGQRMVNAFAHYLQKGMIPITKYGLCPVPVSSKGADTLLDFVKNGGAVEFPASQIVAYGWHRKNPFARLGVRFPQVEAIRDKLQTFVCEACGHTMDFMPDDKSVGSVYRSHLMNSDKYPFRDAVEAVNRAGYKTTGHAPQSIDKIIAARSPLDLPETADV